MVSAAREMSRAEASKTSKSNHIGLVIKSLREQQGKRAIDLSRMSKVDPRTLAAIESGRIKNPSIESLQAIAKVLDMSPAEFFALAESQEIGRVYHGSQKGEAVLDFKEHGCRVISYTPLKDQFFIGKAMLAGGKQITSDILPLKSCVFIQLIMGKLVVQAGLKEYFLKEGDHFLVSCYVSRTLTNPGQRETAFLLTTFPSFL